MKGDLDALKGHQIPFFGLCLADNEVSATTSKRSLSVVKAFAAGKAVQLDVPVGGPQNVVRPNVSVDAS